MEQKHWWALGGGIVAWLLFRGKKADHDCSACANFKARGNVNEQLLRSGLVKKKGGC
jgi:hypothetical protein